MERSGPDECRFWDREAATFDEAADHGLRSPRTAKAWRSLLLSVLPQPPANVVDLGCGTGSLTCLLAEQGFAVHGVDFSTAMVEAARHKAAEREVSATFDVGDAFEPPLPDHAFDAVLVRHVLWLSPDPAGTIARWTRLLRPHGVVLLIEGFWHTGSGLRAAEVAKLAAQCLELVTTEALTDDALWGGPIRDERYLVVGRRPLLSRAAARADQRRW